MRWMVVDGRLSKLALSGTLGQAHMSSVIQKDIQIAATA